MHIQRSGITLYSILLLLVFAVKLSGSIQCLLPEAVNILSGTTGALVTDADNDIEAELAEFFTVNYRQQYPARAVAAQPGFIPACLSLGYSNIIVQPPRKY